MFRLIDTGRIIVEKNLKIKNYPEIFIIGDAASVKDEKGNFLPGVAQVAIQQGKFVAKMINNPERIN